MEGAAYKTPGLFIKGSCAGYGVKDGVDGYLSENDETHYADKICAAMEDKAALKEMGENALKNLYINWKDCADAVLARLTAIVAEKKNGENGGSEDQK